MQATTSSKNLDRADVARRGSTETGYEPHRQGDGCPVRQLDPQYTTTGAILDVGSPWLSFRCSFPGAGSPSEIRTHLLPYPVGHQI
ncbi:MAG TPA: hypothetical protein VK466_17580 [Terriglobales bacterium]|nr:hypothetical protein [Terriglobales bacterium]